MLFTKVAPFLFALGAVAAPAPVSNSVAARDLPTIQTAFGNIQTAVESLGAGVDALTAATPAAQAVADLTAKSQAIVSALDASTASVTAPGQAVLGLLEATNLLSLSDALVQKVSKTVDALIAKKDIVAKAGATATVVQQITAQKASSQKFIDAVVSKVPSGAQTLARNQATAVITALDKGITAFSS